MTMVSTPSRRRRDRRAVERLHRAFVLLLVVVSSRSLARPVAADEYSATVERAIQESESQRREESGEAAKPPKVEVPDCTLVMAHASECVKLLPEVAQALRAAGEHRQLGVPSKSRCGARDAALIFRGDEQLLLGRSMWRRQSPQRNLQLTRSLDQVLGRLRPQGTPLPTPSLGDRH